LRRRARLCRRPCRTVFRGASGRSQAAEPFGGAARCEDMTTRPRDDVMAVEGASPAPGATRLFPRFGGANVHDNAALRTRRTTIRNLDSAIVPSDVFRRPGRTRTSPSASRLIRATPPSSAGPYADGSGARRQGTRECALAARRSPLTRRSYLDPSPTRLRALRAEPRGPSAVPMSPWRCQPCARSQVRGRWTGPSSPGGARRPSWMAKPSNQGADEYPSMVEGDSDVACPCFRKLPSK
jgi:hypothetical protein